MKKLKNEKELVKEAIRIGTIYMGKRGVGEFETTDSAKLKIEYIYRLLIHDKLIQPVMNGQENEVNMKHKLALWVIKQLPEDHPLLK